MFYGQIKLRTTILSSVIRHPIKKMHKLHTMQYIEYILHIKLTAMQYLNKYKTSKNCISCAQYPGVQPRWIVTLKPLIKMYQMPSTITHTKHTVFILTKSLTCTLQLATTFVPVPTYWRTAKRIKHLHPHNNNKSYLSGIKQHRDVMSFFFSQIDQMHGMNTHDCSPQTNTIKCHINIT